PPPTPPPKIESKKDLSKPPKPKVDTPKEREVLRAGPLTVVVTPPPPKEADKPKEREVLRAGPLTVVVSPPTPPPKEEKNELPLPKPHAPIERVE
ncbi:hypothetical protein TELCIR_21506, partial [Teladorsagia circumcincta]